jgi:DNA-binding transcriptional MerR regulator
VADDEDVQIPDKMFFRIGELSELVGVEPHVLRYWESEFRVRPQRSSTGQRMYKRRDIARFLRIKSLLYKQGFTIAGARKAMMAALAGEDTPMASDVEQLRAAVDRIELLRAEIADTRASFAAAWTGPDSSG